MNQQCHRCFSSSFPLVDPARPLHGCAFCKDAEITGSHTFQHDNQHFTQVCVGPPTPRPPAKGKGKDQQQSSLAR